MLSLYSYYTLYLLYFHYTLGVMITPASPALAHTQWTPTEPPQPHETATNFCDTGDGQPRLYTSHEPLLNMAIMFSPLTVSTLLIGCSHNQLTRTPTAQHL